MQQSRQYMHLEEAYMRRRDDVARLVDIVRSSDLEQQYRKQKSLFLANIVGWG